MAGGTALCFVFCTSPDDASLKGGCVMCEGKFSFGMCEPKMFFACLISNKLETKRQ